MSIKIDSQKLKNIKIENRKPEQYNFIIQYVKYMSKYANSPNRKNYWRVVYLYFDKYRELKKDDKFK